VLTREPIKLLEPSSGSTRAAKWIPYSASLQAEIRHAVAPWAFDLCVARPTLLGGPAYWSITPAIPRRDARPGPVPIGFEDDSAYLGGLGKRLIDAALAVPGAVARIRDVDQFRRITLLYLLKSRDLRLISIWHPSFLTLLMAMLRKEWERLITGVAVGLRLDDPAIAIAGDRTRARELARLDPGEPGRIWPRLSLISCWADAHARIHLPELRLLFPGVAIQPKGLMATEACVSIPFRDIRPLAVTSHFFEFLDQEDEPRTAWEIEPGRTYSVVVTTGGGLYRYRLQDRVEVTGHFHQVPCLRFLGKEDHISDLFGEKLSEGFVGSALRRLLTATGLTPRFAMLAPETRGGNARYILFIEASGEVSADLARVLDGLLRENPHYDACRGIGQLAPLELHRVGGEASERYASRLLGRGRKLGEIKPQALDAHPGWSSVFDRRGDRSFPARAPDR
jgi:hypothetical protein